MPASTWTVYLTFGLISMPVRLFSGARSSRIAFHMLHRTDHARVKQQLVCPEEDKVVGRDEIVKGFEYRKGEYVIVEPADIKKIEPKTAKAMEILEFVKAGEVDPIYFESSYYLVPEEAGRRPYALLAQGMQDTATVAVAKLTMPNREYTVLLRPYRGGLSLHTMYYKEEVREIENFGRPDVKLKEPELKVAHQLISALTAKFEPEKYSDTFEENVKKLIRARLEGKEVTEVAKPEKMAPVVDLMAALRQSLEATPKKKSPLRAEAAEEQSEVHEVGKKPSKRKAKKAA